MIKNGLNEAQNLPFGIPSVRYYADNVREFRNIQMDGHVIQLVYHVLMFSPDDELLRFESLTIYDTVTPTRPVPRYERSI